VKGPEASEHLHHTPGMAWADRRDGSVAGAAYTTDQLSWGAGGPGVRMRPGKAYSQATVGESGDAV